MKRLFARRKAAALLAAVLVLTGIALPSQASDEPVTIPDPELPLAISPRLSAEQQYLTLHVPANGASEIIVTSVPVYVLGYESVFTAVVKELLVQMQMPAMQNSDSVPSISLLSVAVSGEAATVNVSNAFLSLTEFQMFRVLYGIVNTLTEFDQIRYVTVLCEDSALLFSGAPVGACTRFESDPSTAMNSMVENQKKRRVQLYFRSNQSFHMLTEVREIRMERDWATDVDTMMGQAIERIIQELATGPRDLSSQARILPSSVQFNTYVARRSMNSADQYEVVIYLTGIGDYFVLNGIDPEDTSRAIAMSVFDFVPQIESVKVAYVGYTGEFGGRIVIDDYYPIYPGAIYRPEVELQLGDLLPVYYPHSSGVRLEKVSKVIDAFRNAQTDEYLNETFADVVDQPDVRPILPEGTGAQDIIQISYSGDIAYVELSQNLYEALRAMEPEWERLSVYAIVNTLCKSRNVSAVQFYVEGGDGAIVPGRVNLSEPLLFSPGIV